MDEPQTSEPDPIQPVKRKPGRPKGAKGKASEELKLLLCRLKYNPAKELVELSRFGDPEFRLKAAIALMPYRYQRRDVIAEKDEPKKVGGVVGPPAPLTPDEVQANEESKATTPAPSLVVIDGEDAFKKASL